MENNIEKSVKNRDSAEEFVFYDGPPFANGTPHYGHIMVSYVKDAVARFQTMNGKKVERRLGWDCHGLPAEMSAEKQLGVSGRKQIEEFGVEKFNDFCVYYFWRVVFGRYYKYRINMYLVKDLA